MAGTQRRHDAKPEPDRIATRQEFAQALTARRERAGLTVREVANALKMPTSTVGGYFSGRHLPPLSPAGQLRDIVRVCGETDDDVIERWYRALYRVRRTPGPRPTGAPVPYRGLEAFQPEHAEWFHGREAFTNLLVKRLAERCVSGGLLVVVGASGAGKSSLLRAGLVPALERGALPGSADWSSVVFEPGRHPLTELRARLAEPAGAAPDSTVHAGDRRQVIVVDQFEETFVACTDEAERRSFVAELAAACGTGPPAVSVVLGLRADFYGHALRYPLLMEALQDAQVVVGPMTEAELRRAIVEPARKANLDIEKELVELLLRDLAPAGGGPAGLSAYDAGALPLLSHALLATWKRSSHGSLTVAAYWESGCIEGAISHSADTVFEALDPDQRETARLLFLQLVHVSEDAADTRRRVRYDELAESGIARGHDKLDEALARFVDQRLVTADTDTVQITHEALLTAWPRLRAWLDADRESLIVYRKLDSATHDWNAHGRDRNRLYRGAHLAEAEVWAKDHDHDVGQLHREFLQAAAQAGRRRVWGWTAVAGIMVAALVAGVLAVIFSRTSAMQRREATGQELVQRAVALQDTEPLQSLLLSIKAHQHHPTRESLSVLLSAQARYYAARLPTSHADVIHGLAVHADGRTLATAGRDGAIELWDMETHTRNGTLRLGSPVYDVAFSPRGTVLASVDERGSVELWDWRTHNRTAVLLVGSGTSANSVVFSHDGAVLVSGHTDGRVRLWDMRAPGGPTLVKGLVDRSPAVEAVAISPNGGLVASASANATVALWDVSSRSLVGQLSHGGAVHAVAFSPDGRLMATGMAVPGGSAAEVWLWEVASRRRIMVLRGHSGSVRALAFTTDGSVLASGDDAGAVRLWEVDSGALRTALAGPTESVTGLVFTKDGRTLVSASEDSTVGWWHVPTSRLPGSAASDTADVDRPSNVPVGSAATVAFDPAGGDDLATVGVYGDVALWSVTRRRLVSVLAGAGSTVSGPHPGSAEVGPSDTRHPDVPGTGATPVVAVFGPDHRALLGGATDGSITRWDLADHTRIETIPGHTKAIAGMAVSPDGLVLASVSDDRTMVLRSTKTWTKLATTTPHSQPLNAVAFSPDGTLVATGGDDRMIRFSRVPTEASGSHEIDVPSELREQDAPVEAVTFSRDGSVLAAAVADTVTLWDTHTRQQLRTLDDHARTVVAVAFSPDGRTLASADEGGVVKLWNVQDLRDSMREPHREPALLATLASVSGATSIAFSPDGHTLVGVDHGGTPVFWDIDPRQVIARVCATLSASTEAAWLGSLPNKLPPDEICSAT